MSRPLFFSTIRKAAHKSPALTAHRARHLRDLSDGNERLSIELRNLLVRPWLSLWEQKAESFSESFTASCPISLFVYLKISYKVTFSGLHVDTCDWSCERGLQDSKVKSCVQKLERLKPRE
jgi:hypothetical protein